MNLTAVNTSLFATFQYLLSKRVFYFTLNKLAKLNYVSKS